jgi:hypothetical protein
MLIRASSGSGGGGGIHKESVAITSGTNTITIPELTDIESVAWQLNTGVQGNDNAFFGSCVKSLHTSDYLIANSTYMYQNPTQYSTSGARSFSGNTITFYWGSATTIDLFVTGT